MPFMSFIIRLIHCFLALFLAQAVSVPLFSQILADPRKEREEIFLARIKQFNEFTDRFNLKTDFYGNPADSAYLMKMPRERMLAMLFDLKDPRIVKQGNEYSAEYVKLKESFISDVTSGNIILYKYSPGIIAEARSMVTYRGQPQKIRLFMVQEIVGRDMVKWVIHSAKGTLLDVFRTDTSMVRFIPPSSNETDFMNLKRALEDTDHLAAYARNDYVPDKLTLLFTLLRSGQLRFEYVEEVIYHVTAIPGWYMQVRDFNRTELNSGWLITDLRRNDTDPEGFVDTL